ncbi:MAG: glucosaminidase domain-containing protein [Patescibacteria group bacterium]|nr:glucosaminidase domain-containing protein [Patescibacteria group bacterium]MDE2015879.1 glucosaminidase domain-containing protein [Patescibacteria group bacterium]MDE2233517.1 glucosaminidase domain-containing protein [Patescibacteria group bacterium]
MDDIYFPGMEQTQPDASASMEGMYFPGMAPAQADEGQQGWSGFVDKASRISQQRGFPTNVLLGQAAIESGRGSAAPGNNYFGIKGSGTGGSNNLATKEYGAGGYYGENSDFAAYEKPEDAINAYIDLVTSYPGVPEAIKSGDTLAVLQAIKNAGYATSPTYVNDVSNTPEFRGQYGSN